MFCTALVKLMKVDGIVKYRNILLIGMLLHIITMIIIDKIEILAIMKDKYVLIPLLDYVVSGILLKQMCKQKNKNPEVEEESDNIITVENVDK